MVGRAEDPDEEDAPRGDGAGRVAREEVPRRGHLVRDADAASEEQDGAVGGEGLRAAVGAFDEGGEGEAVVGVVEGLAVDVVAEAGAAADDEGDGGLGQGESIGRWSGGLDPLFGVVGAEALGRGVVGPGDGEWMGGPEADGGYGEEEVLARFERPWAGDAEGDAHSVAGEDLNIRVGAATADVAVDEGGETNETFNDPECDDGFQVFQLLEAIQMDP